MNSLENLLYFRDQVTYEATDVVLDVDIWQEALCDMESSLAQDLMKNGWTSYLQELEKAFSDNKNEDLTIIKTDGVRGASAYLQDGGAIGLWMLHIFCGEYKITVNLTNTSFSHVDSEEEIAWKQAKLEEIGNFAVERLTEILG